MICPTCARGYVHERCYYCHPIYPDQLLHPNKVDHTASLKDAAPDLLAKCKEARKLIFDFRVSPSFVIELDAAIARAEGRTV